MRISIDTFSGIVPKVAPRLLAANQAQVARNARLTSGDLEAWRDTVPVDGLVKDAVRTLYLFEDDYWFQWSEIVDVVRGPVPDDTQARTYFTGAGVPQFTDAEVATSGASGAYPAVAYHLGLPAPAGGVSATTGGTATEDDPALIETRAYVYTYVSRYGEEGPPSAASNFVDVLPGQYVDLTGITAPTGQFVVETARIYRTASSGAATEFQFVAEVPIGSGTWQDTVDADALGELLPSEGWIAPPEDMHSLVAMPNGILAGASGLDICISEQYLPHAWPLDYRHTADDEVVGLGVIGNSLVVLTRRAPYVITGASPASMTMTRIASDEFACVSKRGIAALPGVGVVFPTPDGLGAITPSGAQLLTYAYMDRDDWQAYAPESMVGAAHQGRYFGFHAGGCLVYDPRESDGALYDLDLTADGVYRDPATDTLYLAVDDQILAWDRAPAAFASYVWRSKRYELPIPAAFSAILVRAVDYGDITVRVYADDVLVAEVVPTAPHPLRLPIGSRAQSWEIEVSGRSRVHSVQIAELMDEIA